MRVCASDGHGVCMLPRQIEGLSRKLAQEEDDDDDDASLSSASTWDESDD